MFCGAGRVGWEHRGHCTFRATCCSAAQRCSPVSSMACLGTLPSCGLERDTLSDTRWEAWDGGDLVMLDRFLSLWQGTCVWRGGWVAELLRPS